MQHQNPAAGWAPALRRTAKALRRVRGTSGEKSEARGARVSAAAWGTGPAPRTLPFCEWRGGANRPLDGAKG